MSDDFSGSNEPSNNRLTLVNLMGKVKEGDIDGQDVIEGLSTSPQKSLPPKYFYDERGSQLFEQICELPEYYPTRTETEILKGCSNAIAQTTGPCEIIELGSGSSTKTRILLNAYQSANYPLRYLPVDVSDTMLSETAHSLLQEYPTLSIHAIASTYEPALRSLPPRQLPTKLIAFIGSTIGNLQPKECNQFLALIKNSLAPDDYFLLGLDWQKDTTILEAAYNDAQHVTAAFNLNMLQHLNEKFQGDFDLNNFEHIAHYNTQANQIEMYLESLVEQTVRLKKLNLTVEFKRGEQILSEVSRKFNLEEMTRTLSAHQLDVIKPFIDQNRWFGLLLCRRSA